jgi:NADPH:quinone reductase
MKAWRVHENGEPGAVMRLEEAPDRTAAPGGLLLRVRAAGVNFPDALLCRGHYQVRPPLPFTPGVELCGEVVALGEDVPEGTWAVGDRVIGPAVLPDGAFAEYAAVPHDAVLPAPQGLDDAQAAVLHIGYQTGWFGLHRRAALRSGETLLVHAAAGGVGTAAVQLGRAAGATVIGVVGGAEKAEVAKTAGCDVVVDRTTEDFVQVVKEVTGGRGADVVYDPVGGDAFTRSTKCIAFEGRIVVVGFASGTIPAPALSHALVKNYSISGLHWGLYAVREPSAIRACHEDLTRMVAAGDITPMVTEHVPFDRAADAVQRVADGVTTGRLAVLGT